MPQKALVEVEPNIFAFHFIENKTLSTPSTITNPFHFIVSSRALRMESNYSYASRLQQHFGKGHPILQTPCTSCPL